MKKLYFVRHGQSEMNVAQRFAGSTDTPLTELGRQQAKDAGKIAQDLGLDLIISSPSSRALETAQIIAKEIGYPVEAIQTSKLLMEQDYGTLEGQKWGPGLDFEEHGVEPMHKVVERAELALDWINNHEADHILVVSHGSFGRALRSLVNSKYTLDHHEGLNNAEIVSWIED